MKTRVALYARVSTSNGQQDPEMQLRELREYAQHRDLTIIGEYIDKMTGSKDSRPALNRLMADASQRKFDAVLVWKLDRFGRSLRHLVNALAELEALGLSFISLRDNLDLSTPSGRLMFQIIGAMAEFERSLIQERVKAGLRNARAKGKKLGRPRADVDEAKVEALRASGASWRDVAEKLGVGIGTVHRIAQRKTSAGTFRTAVRRCSMHNVTKFPFPPDQELALRSTNEKIARLAAVKPYSDIQSAFVFAAHLATEALQVAIELERMPGIDPGQMQFVVNFWYSLADHARTAALACVGGNQTLAEATVAFLFLQASCARKPAASEAPLQAVATLLGHARLSTAQIYTRVSVGRMMQTYNKAHPHARG